MRIRIYQLGIAVIASLGAAAVDAGELPAAFTGQYRPAIEKLREAYANLTADGLVTVDYPRDSKSSDQQFDMRVGGESRRLDLKVIAQQNMGLKVGSNVMRMATPDGSMNAETQPGHKFFDDAQQTGYDQTVAAIDRGCLLNYPYALDAQTTVLDMLRSSAVKVNGVKWVRAEGEPLVQVSYVQQGTHAGKTGRWNSKVLLWPANGWAVHSFSRALGQGHSAITQNGHLEYTTSPTGIPQVRAIRVETTEGNQLIRRQMVQVNSIKFGPPEPYSFTAFEF
jgi:hypothetical protein